MVSLRVLKTPTKPSSFSISLFLPPSNIFQFVSTTRDKMEDPRWYQIWQFAKAYGLFLDARGKPDNAAYKAAYRAQLDEIESNLRPANADEDVWDDWCRWHAEHKLWKTHCKLSRPSW
jgi:hypothetical protein